MNDKVQVIKSALIRRGITQKEIANLLLVHPVSVHQVITGQRKNPRIRKAIAISIGKNVDEIEWPETKKK